AKLCGLKLGCTEAVRISISAAPLAGRMRCSGADVTQCAAVSTRSRASAVPVHTLPREPSTITTERATPSCAVVAPPTMAAAGRHRTKEKARAPAARDMPRSSHAVPICQYRSIVAGPRPRRRGPRRSGAVAQLAHAFRLGAVDAAIDGVVLLDAVAHHMGATVRAGRRQRLNR